MTRHVPMASRVPLPYASGGTEKRIFYDAIWRLQRGHRGTGSCCARIAQVQGDRLGREDGLLGSWVELYQVETAYDAALTDNAEYRRCLAEWELRLVERGCAPGQSGAPSADPASAKISVCDPSHEGEATGGGVNGEGSRTPPTAHSCPAGSTYNLSEVL